MIYIMSICICKYLLTHKFHVGELCWLLTKQAWVGLTAGRRTNFSHCVISKKEHISPKLLSIVLSNRILLKNIPTKLQAC